MKIKKWATVGIIGAMALLGGTIYAVGFDTFLGKLVRIQCIHFYSTDSCPQRALNAGHRLFANGKQREATYAYYEIVAISHNPIRSLGQFHFAWGNLYLISELLSQNIASQYEDNWTQEMFTNLFMAAQEGFAPAMNNLGQIYYFGIGTPVDKAKAFKWHLAAAKAGNPVAALNVSSAYLRGDGVEQSIVEAEKWAKLDFSHTNNGDLESPTIERTLLLGNSLSEAEISSMRKAAEQGIIYSYSGSPELSHPLEAANSGI